MCGISGIITNKSLNPNEIRFMTDIIRHRGPDDEGFAFFNNDDNTVLAGGKDTTIETWKYQSSYQPTKNIDTVQGNFQVAFGHRRLSILDLSPAGHQPMSYQNQRYWITYNGEIYNYKELYNELIGVGYSFNTKTDTEVILASYAYWGVECLYHFNGMWSFCIYDRTKKEIFLARDRFGIKPLYYWIMPNGDFAFASEIKQFTTLSGWVPKINSQRAYDYLVYSMTDHTEETMFKDVYQIPGGHFFKSSTESLQKSSARKIIPEKWYNLKYTKFKGSFKEAASEFKQLFQSAINLQLNADVPVGTSLSGGLDSSAIVCEVNNILRSQDVQELQKTFSSCSIDDRYDERKWVDIVVEYTDVNALFIYPSYEDIFNPDSKLTWYNDEPYQSQSAYLGYHVFKSADLNNIKVLLNGQGADEYLGGYGQFSTPRYIEMFRKINWISLFNDIKHSRGYKQVLYSDVLQSIVLASLPESLYKFLTKRFGSNKRIKSLIDNRILGALNKHPYDAIQEKHQTVPEISKYLTLFSTLPKYLKWEDRNSMANSIEARVPFLDHRLVEFTYNLPDEYLDYHGETKRVLREGLRNILPEKIRLRKDKKGFITPEERWVREDNPGLFRFKLKEAIENSGGIIKQEALSYFDDTVSGKIPFDYTYWRLIQFAEWMKIFDIKNN